MSNIRILVTLFNQYTFGNLLILLWNDRSIMGKRDIFSIEVGKNNQRTAVDPCLEPCPIERGMRVIGGKWTGSILWHLKDKPVRFNDLSRQLGGASKKMIAQRLKKNGSK